MSLVLALLLIDLPASFSGVIPCADCPGIRLELRLDGQGLYVLKQTYLETPDGDRSFADYGRWSLEGTVLTLHGERQWKFSSLGRNGLRMLDREGKESDSGLSYDLARLPTSVPLDVRLSLRGTYTYMADAGWFTDCRTGLRFLVAQEGDNARLEAEYGKARKEPGSPVLAVFEGRFATRPKMEGEGEDAVVLVDRFERVAADESCEMEASQGSQAVTALLGTRWDLVEIEGETVGGVEAYLTLDGATERASGSGGCNRFSGPYELEGDALRFGAIAATRMACLGSMDVEVQFFRKLDAVERYRIQGERLELLGGAGEVLLLFEAGTKDP